MREEQQLFYRESEDSRELVLTMLESINCPRALSFAILYRHGQLRDALELRFSPNDYECPTEFARAWQAQRLLAKADFLDLGVDRAAKALSSFKDAEAHCRRVNRKLRTRPLTGRSHRIFSIARGKISALLGELDTRKIETILGLARWGDGSTSSTKGRFTQRVNKIASSADHTPALGFVQRSADLPPWFPVQPAKVVPGNKVVTVPKNWKTDRTIAVEPTVNSALQRGVGRFLAARLRWWGIKVDDQEPNQRLARLGSIDDSYVTIDLSMASDTISQGVLELLLPSDWLALLNTLRSPCYFNEGAWHVYEKHSSMGNGYTFELETLIFSALLLACRTITSSTGDYSVFGDDIVCERRYAGLLLGALRVAGFLVNHDKSFTAGSFRESCGAEYYRGVLCTPYYLRKLDTDRVTSRYTLMNWLRSPGSRFMSRTKRLWYVSLRQVPRKWVLPGPANIADTIHVQPWEDIRDSQIVECDFRVPTVYRGRRGYTPKARLFAPLKQPLSGLSGVIETCLRLGEAIPIRELPLLGVLEPISHDNVSRRVGRLERRTVIVDDWPLVGALR